AYTDLIDIERVEVLRGPQSTLFGKNASAGVVNVVTKRPASTFEAEGDVTVAELDEYRVRGSVSTPITDTLGIRLTGFYTDVGGHIDNQFDDREFNGAKRYGGRAKLDWDITPDVNFYLIGDYRKSEDDCCVYQARSFTDETWLGINGDLTPSPTNREVNVNAPIFNDTESWGASGEFTVALGDHTLTSITAYRDWDFANGIDIDTTPSIGGVTGFDINNGQTDIKQISQEVRLTSPAGGAIEYIVGAYFFDLALDRRFERKLCLAGLAPDDCPQISIPPAPGLPAILPLSQSGFFEGEVDNRNYAAFADVTWNATDRLSLIGGLRVIREELDVFLFRPVEPLFPGDAVLNAQIAPANIFVDEDNDGQLDDIVQNGDISDTAVTGRAVVQYDLDDDVNIYGSYTRGYKGPTADVAFDPDFVPGGDRSEFVNVDPETSDAYEIGFRSQFLDRRLTLNVTAFYATYDDFQSQSFDSVATTFVLSNVGSVETKGVEIEAAIRPMDSLRFDFGFAYTDASVDSFPNGQCFTPNTADPDCVDGVKNLAGATLPNSPKYRFIMSTRLDQPLSNGLDGFVQTNLRFQSDTQFSLNQNPNTIQDGYAIVDASLGVASADDRWTVTGFVKNLFDKNYVNFLFQDPLYTGTVNIDQYAPKDADRYFGGSVRFRF
ncbi:MAG: TonB-dependent receptor, partial [Pacificimonas sp.]